MNTGINYYFAINKWHILYVGIFIFCCCGDNNFLNKKPIRHKVDYVNINKSIFGDDTNAEYPSDGFIISLIIENNSKCEYQLPPKNISNTEGRFGFIGVNRDDTLKFLSHLDIKPINIQPGNIDTISIHSNYDPFFEIAKSFDSLDFYMHNEMLSNFAIASHLIYYDFKEKRNVVLFERDSNTTISFDDMILVYGDVNIIPTSPVPNH